MKKAELYFNTIKYMKCSQIFYRFFRKLTAACKVHGDSTIKQPVRISIREIDLDQGYLDRFDCDALLNNELFLLNERHRVNFADWTIEGETTRLWVFNLHYMEYLIPMAVCYNRTKQEIYYDKIREIIDSWLKRYEKADCDAWNSYTISERFVNWLIVLELLGNRIDRDYLFKSQLEKSLYRQYRFLKVNQEKHLLGNHYFENLKALIIAGIIFKDQKILRRYLKNFQHQIQEQVLEDGMHYERSFMYHNIIMEDILRVLTALNQVQGYDLYKNICTTVLGKMLGCALSFESRIDRIPLFNDAGNNVAKSVTTLERGIRKYLPDQQSFDSMCRSLPGAGYYRYEREDMICIIDCGEIGPRYIPGHGHCDCLSFEMFFNGVPVIVNSGTYQYQSVKRPYFRSTRAHNCFTIDGEEQSQCWGEHRVARRISEIRAVNGKEEFEGYCRFWNGAQAHRKMKFEQSCVIVEDVCDNKPNAMIRSYLHLTPDTEVTKLNERQYQLVDSERRYRVSLEVVLADCVLIHDQDEICWYSEEFGSLQKSKVFEMSGNKVNYKLNWRMDQW